MLITDEYRALNQELHEGDGWGKGGLRYVDEIVSLATGDILDYGCGKGRLVDTLVEQGFDALGYDPCVPKYENTLKYRILPFSLLVSTDVLEHIEPDCLEDVLKDIRRWTGQTAYLAIALGPAHMILPDGRNAHLIQESQDWWKDRLSTHFKDGTSTSRWHGRNAGTMRWTWQRNGES